MIEVEGLDPSRLLGVLVEHEVDFVVIGGLAALVHGARRMTLDVDLVPRPTTENFERLARALEHLDVEAAAVDGEMQHIDPRDAVDLARSRNVSLRTSAGRLDVLNRAKGSPPYDDLVERAVRVELGDVSALVVGRDDLLAMKLASARPRDLLDVADITASAGDDD